MPLKKMKDVPKHLRLKGRKVPGPDIPFNVNIADEALQELEGRLGVKFGGHARTFDPKLPDNITTIGDDQLGELEGQVTAMSQWLEEQLALLEVRAAVSSVYLDRVAAEVRLTKSGTVSDKGAKVLMDPKYVQAQEEALFAKARYKLLKAKVVGYDKAYTALSREQTRREKLRDRA